MKRSAATRCSTLTALALLLAAGCVNPGAITSGAEDDATSPREPDAAGIVQPPGLDARPQIDARAQVDARPAPGSPDARPSSGGADAGPPPTGLVGPTGGSVDRLRFAAFGDVRPPVPNSSSYPTAIITSIMSQANALPTEFLVGTGDYMFATYGSTVTTQMATLKGAEAHYKRQIFHALGNHECTGATDSNCPNGTETPNMIAFMTELVPFTTTPYYSVTITTSMGDAKFVFIAANAWDGAQAAWLDQELSVPTRYTFVVRHEPPGNTQALGCAPSDKIIKAHPVTLELYGHTHEYRHVSARQVITGNAGAPLQPGATHYGFLDIEQRSDGNIEVREIDQSSGSVTDKWAVTPTGTATP